MRVKIKDEKGDLFIQSGADSAALTVHRLPIRSTPQGGLAHRMSSLRCAIRSVLNKADAVTVCLPNMRQPGEQAGGVFFHQQKEADDDKKDGNRDKNPYVA